MGADPSVQRQVGRPSGQDFPLLLVGTAVPSVQAQVGARASGHEPPRSPYTTQAASSTLLRLVITYTHSFGTDTRTYMTFPPLSQNY